MTLARAGHPEQYLITASGTEELRPQGPIVGIRGDLAYDEEVRSFNEGDVLFLYTDGLFNLISAHQEKVTGLPEFDEAPHLVRAFGDITDESTPAEACDAILRRFQKGYDDVDDDITVIVVKRVQ